jgi:hypothetical protein
MRYVSRLGLLLSVDGAPIQSLQSWQIGFWGLSLKSLSRWGMRKWLNRVLKSVTSAGQRTPVSERKLRAAIIASLQLKGETSLGLPLCPLERQAEGLRWDRRR